MKILILGSGGRENALSWKLSQSEAVSKIYLLPGEGLPFPKCENILIPLQNQDEIVKFVHQQKIDLTIVGPEGPLCEGIVDRFKNENLKIFGPDKRCAQLEKSKYFTKQFLQKYQIATANYEVCHSEEQARHQLEKFSFPMVMKADGLCLGKGVQVCYTREEAYEFLHKIFVDRIFGEEGKQVLLEEFLEGQECSLLCFVSHNKIFPMETAQDYKRIFEGDQGPNTGGVGAYSPNESLSQKDLAIKKILQKIEEGFQKEQLDYTGILFIGLMMTDEPKVLEFNVRFGDPETEVMIPRMGFDLLTIIQKTIEGNLVQADLQWKQEVCVGVVATAKGYPGTYEKGKEIRGYEQLSKDIIFFQNGTKYDVKGLQTNGGRVFTLVALGNTYEEAREKVYQNMEKISFEGMTYRKDIGVPLKKK